MNLLTQPWPWYISGPLIGLMIPTLLILGNKSFGISSSLRHICAAVLPGKIGYFDYNWKKEAWKLIFVLGVITGGFVAGKVFENPNPIQLSANTISDLNTYGITDFSGLHPQQLFNFQSLLTLKGFVLIVVGGFCVGFGTRYAGGCTSGHSIMGISNLQIPSIISTCCFFAGGLIMTWLILPYILKL
ncbi:MAG: YeeE/YedE family protein [Bacteroidia bacterium]|nr:YeeE/YedE family protein [Bacteroidia bacterium]